MNTVVKTKFAVKPVVAAVALAVSAGGALADPNPNALPGGGVIVRVNPGTTFSSPNYTVSGVGGLNDTIRNAKTNAATISIDNPCIGCDVFGVIRWGGAGVLAEVGIGANPLGFNIGQTAKLTFTDNTLLNQVAILNVDASGNPSQIFGQLEVAKGAGTGRSMLFVSNANGIIVGPDGRIALPDGGGLIGADLSGATSLDDFIANNFQGRSYINYSGGLSEVWIQKGASFTGSLTVNEEARYILLAGGNVVNEGNLFGQQVDIVAGLIAAPGKATVNAVPNTVVNRLFSTEGMAALGWPVFGGFSTVDGNLGTTNPSIAVAPAPVGYKVNSAVGAYGTVVNLGNITAEQGPGPEFVGISAANGIRSGTAGDPNLLVGINSDGAVVLNTFNATAKTELYNVVSGYILNPIMPSLDINQSKGAEGDVIINALTPASQPSSITTTGEVNIFGRDVTISSTINHLVDSAANFPQLDSDLVIVADRALTITANIGAGADVILVANGPMTISGNVLSDTDKLGNGGIYIENYGTQSGNTTTISGNLTTNKTSFDDITVHNHGASNSKLIITGKIETAKANHGDVEIFSAGLLDFGGTILGSDDVNIAVYGNSMLLRGPITADNSGDLDGLLSIAAPTAQTKVYTSALLTAPTVLLGFDGTNTTHANEWVGIHNFTGVQDSGASYTAESQKPAVQIMTNNLVLDLLGSFNAPVNPGTNTNWLLNSMPIAAQDKTSPVAISLSAVGAGFQAINMHVTGDVIIDSGRTFTPFIDVPLTTGLEPAGALIGNGGSQLIVRATGNLDIVGDSGAQTASWGGGPGFNVGVGSFVNNNDGFLHTVWQFPGGEAFITPATLNQFVPMYNAWTVEAMTFQGTFLEGLVINAFGFYALNGNSWVNFSTMPTAGVPTAYQIRQFGDGVIFPISFGFQAAPDAPHLNAYTKVLTGTPVNTCPIGFVC